MFGPGKASSVVFWRDFLTVASYAAIVVLSGLLLVSVFKQGKPVSRSEADRNQAGQRKDDLPEESEQIRKAQQIKQREQQEKPRRTWGDRIANYLQDMPGESPRASHAAGA